MPQTTAAASSTVKIAVVANTQTHQLYLPGHLWVRVPMYSPNTISRQLQMWCCMLLPSRGRVAGRGPPNTLQKQFVKEHLVASIFLGCHGVQDVG